MTTLLILSSPHCGRALKTRSLAAAILGGIAGGLMLHKVNERVLRTVIVLIGVALT